MSFYYLATPYSSYEDGIQEAFLDACEQAALLIKAGIPVYSPVAHLHPIAIMGEIDPIDYQVDRPIKNAATNGLIVCMLPGWETSTGVSKVIQYFTVRQRPVIYMVPDAVPDCLCRAF